METVSRLSEPYRELVRRYRGFWTTHDYRFSAAIAVFVFFGSVAASFLAGHFSDTHASNSVADIVLSNTPALDLDGFFVYGTFLFVALVAALGAAYPRRIPFMFFSLAIFFFIRSAFVTLTHIAPFPEQAAIDFGETIQRYFFGSDLFFSGHTGSPFLMALVFWESWRLRIMFLGWSVFFAFVVLLGHLHYSIDVASAYFITYTIYRICEYLLPEYRALFFSEWGDDAV